MTNKLVVAFSILTLICPIAANSTSYGPRSSMNVPGVTTIDTTSAKELFDTGVVFIDVRSDEDWFRGRIADAEHLNSETKFTKENLARVVINKTDPIVIYSNGRDCNCSYKMSSLAVNLGYTMVYYFRDGYPAWKNAKYPVE